jgi:hypothetical protein
VLVLHGLNLEIADAANKSGFNTRNQVALMDLIWSVRRVAFRHAVKWPTIERPPKHPVYPDRYRPGDRSDNTKRRRKRGREPEWQKNANGTVDSPIELDRDEIDANETSTAANSSAKRLKVAISSYFGRHKVERPDAPKALNPLHPSKFEKSSNKRQERGRPATRNTTYMPSPRSLNLPAPRPSSVAPIFHLPRPLVTTPRDITMVELRKVENTLRENAEAVLESSRVMKEMYGRDDRLGDDIIYKELEKLKGAFDNCISHTDMGMQTVKKIISFLEDSKDHVMTTNDRIQ